MSPAKFSRLDPEQRRDQILDAAGALLADRPYGEVSIEDVASAAGVTRGLVHHYFGGRDELYVALLRRLGDQREDELRLPVGSSARARVADTVSRWLDWTEANRTIWLATSARGEDVTDADVAETAGPRRRAAHHLSPRPRRRLPATAPRARVLDRAEPRRDTTLADGKGDPRRDARAARLNARARPAHVRRHPPRNRTMSHGAFRGLTAVPLPRSGRHHSGRSILSRPRDTAPTRRPAR